MTIGTYREHLGSQFSEGARQMWLRLPKKSRQWKVRPESLREELTKRLGVGRGTVSRYMYGDRKPGRSQADGLKSLLGIPTNSWDQAPKEAFSLSTHGAE